MSLYNMLHGVDPMAPLLLRLLRFDHPSSVARFRDIHLSGDAERILLLTRTGGGNREDYQDWWNKVRQHPEYIKDFDDDFDSTFAHIEFHVPGHVKGVLKSLATGKDPISLKDKTTQAIEEMKGMTKEQLANDPRTKDLVSALEKILNDKGGIIEI